MNRQQRRATEKSPPPSAAAGPFVAALQHHQAGRLAQAEAAYRSVLAADPGHADAAFNLAVALRQQDRIDDAIAAYARLLAIRPDYPEAQYNLGNALMARGRPDDAVAAYTEALRLKPDHARARPNLGIACASLGATLLERGAVDEAAAAFSQALGINPGHAETHYNLGNARRLQGRHDDAAAAYREAIRINLRLAEAHSNLGNVLADLGRFDEALAAHREAVAIRPESADVFYNLGNALKASGQLDDAADAYSEAVRLDAGHATAHGNLGIVRMGQGRLDDAAAAYARAIALRPDDSDTFSNLLFCLNYDDRQAPEQLFAAHGDWDRRYGRPLPAAASYANDRTPARRLKVGYVSPDFRAHSVAYFVTPLFEAHDRQAVELFCYAGVIRPDAVTARLQDLSDHWLSTVGMTDDGLAARIRADGIDILVDLAGHTAHNRLRVFAQKPAPVQATWLGYSNTTGLRAIDYRIVDDVTDPAGAADAVASETLLRLPGGFLCYGGAKDAPEPAPLPRLANGAITFGSFNNPAKVSAATFDVWARLLTRMPTARLLLKGKSFADPGTCDAFLTQLGNRGIAPDRIELMAWLPSNAAHLSLYDRIDIALDPFPYNGTTTTCEALWMGVPVVTLKGDRHAARVGASLLTQAGLDEWIAGSVDDYVETALRLAADPQRLHELRRGLRARLVASPLCDARGFARRMEAAYAGMWQRWCSERTA
ncbi:MAG: tetratricopeptide repeat protein [Pseudolabrys sp.]|nr:tetratricopeptide repeat protein [Pseudolabrys sp.]